MNSSRGFFPMVVLVCLCSCAAYASTPTTYIRLNSQPGDYIGGGKTYYFTPADGTFSVQNFPTQVNISFNTPDFSESWGLDFGTPQAMNFARGQYVGAQRTPFRSPMRPGVDVSGDGRGCNTDTGQFLVSDFALAQDGTVARLAIDFEQHCEGATPALYGSVRYNSSVSARPRLGVAGTFALKGNAGTSDALIPIALSIPSSHVVTVQYATADATGKAGIDYVSITGTVTFPAGTTFQTIVVPIIGDRRSRGNKTFRTQLNTATGAVLGPGVATVLIRDPNVPQSVLAMSSQPGDFIGGGQQFLITQSDAVFTPHNSGNTVTIQEQNGDYWETDFAGPTTARLNPGEYLHAQRYPFEPQGTPGLSVSGQFRGCNTLTGNFYVLKAVYGTTGSLQDFAANFEQHCEGATPALFGWVRVHSLLEQFSVSDAVIQGSSAVFTVTLYPSRATSASVNFSTADGTAVAGIDYMATSQTVNFSPGTLEQTVTVPLLTSGNNPKKTFYGQLSSPSDAAVWIGQDSAIF